MKKTMPEEQYRVGSENPGKGGVKTPEGKEISKYNALKHGILSNALTDHDKDDFKELHERLLEECRPQSTIEAILVERVALYQLRLERAAKAETRKIRHCLHSRRFPDLDLNLGLDSEEYNSPGLDSADIENLEGVYLRYEKTLENRQYRALHELERIQRARAGDSVIAPLVVDSGTDDK